MTSVLKSLPLLLYLMHFLSAAQLLAAAPPSSMHELAYLMPGSLPKDRWQLTIRVTPSKSLYDASDQIAFKVESQEDCYVTLIMIDPAGHVTQLCPSDENPSGRIRADRPLLIPMKRASEKLRLGLRLGPNFGMSYLKAMGTKFPVHILPADGFTPRKMGAFTSLGTLLDGKRVALKTRIQDLNKPVRWTGGGLGLRSVKNAVGFNIAGHIFPDPFRPQTQPRKQVNVPRKKLVPKGPLIFTKPNAYAYVPQAWENAQNTVLEASPIFMASGTRLSVGEVRKNEFIVYQKGMQAQGDLMKVALKDQVEAQNFEAQSLDAQIKLIKKETGASVVVPNRQMVTFDAQVSEVAQMPRSRYAKVQWALYNRAHPGCDTGWARAYKTIQNIEGSLIGVVDSGLHIHDLKQRAMAWRNPGEFPDNGIDDDKNGYVDDLYGVNIADPTQPLKGAFRGFNHGSFVSSIIAARPDGTMDSMIGFSSKSKIISANVFKSDQTSTTFDVLQGIAYCMQQGARVINLSLGQQMPRSEINALAELPLFYELQKRGVILVAAAGNSHKDIEKHPMFPASIGRDNIISVMAIDPAGRRAHALAPPNPDLTKDAIRPTESGTPLIGSQKIDGIKSAHNTINGKVDLTSWKPYSNYGRFSVDLAAPGSLILGIAEPGKLALADGTSYAAPMVTAAVSLIQGKHPDWPYQKVIKAILETARPAQALKFDCKTGGVLDIEAALMYQ